MDEDSEETYLNTTTQQSQDITLENTDSKLDVSKENIDKGAKHKIKKMPFICASSASKSYNMGVNIQTALSMIEVSTYYIKVININNNKIIKTTYYDDLDRSINPSTNFIVETKLNKNSKTSLISQQFSDLQLCPAISEDKFTNQEDGNLNTNPWAVKQTDNNENHFEFDLQKNSCSCPNRFMESYHKVMAPFMKQLKRKSKSIENPQNPYNKAKVVQYYELLSKEMQSLNLSISAMRIEFKTLQEKYNKLYDKYIRDQNQNIIPILIDTEDKINAIESKVHEAYDVYKEVAFVSSEKVFNSSSNMLADINNANEDPRPKETTTIYLSKVLRRVQCLQEKLKTGHFLHGCGDQPE
ncbi:hypothetical protein ACI65C_005482 [Semiaphis heraclei]